jgi:hypothetical protein
VSLASWLCLGWGRSFLSALNRRRDIRVPSFWMWRNVTQCGAPTPTVSRAWGSGQDFGPPTVQNSAKQCMFLIAPPPIPPRPLTFGTRHPALGIRHSVACPKPEKRRICRMGPHSHSLQPTQLQSLAIPSHRPDRATGPPASPGLSHPRRISRKKPGQAPTPAPARRCTPPANPGPPQSLRSRCPRLASCRIPFPCVPSRSSPPNISDRRRSPYVRTMLGNARRAELFWQKPKFFAAIRCLGHSTI